MPVARRTGLRAREIVFAVAMGGLAAGGAALVLVQDEGAPMMVATQGPDNLTYDLAPFEQIATVGPQDVVITYGETQSIRAEGPSEALARLEVVVEDGELTIRPKGQPSFNGWGRFTSTTFHVTVPRLERVSLAGSGDITADRIEGDHFEGTIAGPGKLSIASLNVDEAEFTIGGSGDVVAAGTAREADVRIGGSGTVEAGGLRSQNASVSIGGSGDVALTVEDQARISIAGSGDVDISGPARCSLTRMGSGDVRCNGQSID